AARAVAPGEEHARRTPWQPRQPEAVQAAAQMRQVRPHRLPVPGARRVRHQAALLLVAPAPADTLERGLGFLMPKAREPRRARLAQRTLLHRVDQAANEERI